MKKGLSSYDRKIALDKRRATCYEKYGVDNVNKVLEVRDRIEETCHKKYGKKSPLSKTNPIVSGKNLGTE